VTKATSRALVIGSVIVWLVIAAARAQLPAMGAGGLLHPGRRGEVVTPPSACAPAAFSGLGVNLAGWRCRAATERRGTIIYLHGIADNRSSAVGLIDRFTPMGFDVVAYDGRAHGESDGAACTYGFFEKQDLQLVIDGVEGPVVLVGTSLGAAVALHQAGRDARVSAVVAAESFSDLRTVATERAPFFFTAWAIERAFSLAEQEGHFRIDDVSPVSAASSIKVPVLLIHGAQDEETPPSHAQRIFAALAGPKKLVLVPGAGHNESLQGDIWNEIERWLLAAAPPQIRPAKSFP
jgi:uncharacterized protein